MRQTRLRRHARRHKLPARTVSATDATDVFCVVLSADIQARGR